MRYWAASARLGTDTAFEEGQLKIGRKLAMKILNVSRFVLRMGDDADTGTGRADLVTEAIDRAMLTALVGVVADSTRAFESYDSARALERTERFFWGFCDDYVELVKTRAYGDGDARATASAIAASAHRARHDVAAVRTVPPLCHRGGVVVVARGVGAPGTVAHRRWHWGGGPCRVRGRRGRALGGPQGEVPAAAQAHRPRRPG